MTTSVAGAIELERRIAARPETVFAYFTDPDRFTRWQGVDAELDPRPGGVFRVTVTGRSRLVARGVFVEVDPPTRVVFTWGWEPIDGVPADDVPEGVTAVPPGTSTVEVVLVPDGDGTVLRLRHGGLPTDPARRFHTDGWGYMLDRLASVAAARDPGPYDPALL